MRAGAEATDHGLHGLAQDQDTFYVEADMEARAQEQEAAMTGAEAGALETAPAAYNNLTTPPATEAAAQQVVGRQLRDIVRDSTEQWQLPTTEADAEYLEELRVIGFQPEQLKARMAMRAREYQQMLAEGCTRAQQGVPERIPNLGHIRVRAVSAGYAHVMLLSDEGRLYGAGYNDRGQLGLGCVNLNS